MEHFSQMCCEKVDFFLLYRIFRLLSSYSSHLFTISLSAITDITTPKASPLGVTPHGVGRCPEGTEGTAQYEGDRRRRWRGSQLKPFFQTFQLYSKPLNHPIQHPSITRTSCAFGCAPITVCTRAPPSKKQNVGMLEMPNCMASACCSSTFTL